MLSRAFDHICMEKARYKFLIIIIIIIIIINITFAYELYTRRKPMGQPLNVHYSIKQ